MSPTARALISWKVHVLMKLDKATATPGGGRQWMGKRRKVLSCIRTAAECDPQSHCMAHHSRESSSFRHVNSKKSLIPQNPTYQQSLGGSAACRARPPGPGMHSRPATRALVIDRCSGPQMPELRPGIGGPFLGGCCFPVDGLFETTHVQSLAPSSSRSSMD